MYVYIPLSIAVSVIGGSWTADDNRRNVEELFYFRLLLSAVAPAPRPPGAITLFVAPVALLRSAPPCPAPLPANK